MIRRLYRRLTGTTKRNVRVFTPNDFVFYRPIRANTSNTTLAKPTTLNDLLATNGRLFVSGTRRTTIILPLVLNIMMIRNCTRVYAMVNKKNHPPFRATRKISKTPIITKEDFNLTLMRTTRRRIRRNRIVTRHGTTPRTIRYISTTTRPTMNNTMTLLYFIQGHGLVKRGVAGRNHSTLFSRLNTTTQTKSLSTTTTAKRARLLTTLKTTMMIMRLTINPLVLRATRLAICTILRNVMLMILLHTLKGITTRQTMMTRRRRRRARPYRRTRTNRRQSRRRRSKHSTRGLIRTVNAMTTSRGLARFFSRGSYVLYFKVGTNTPTIVLRFLKCRSAVVGF